MSRSFKHDGGYKVRKKNVILLVSLTMLIFTCIGGTLAFLIASTNDVVNTFTPSQVITSVEESIENGVKTDVVIRNDKNSVKAYIRADIIVNWVNDNGDVWASAPAAGDYVISINETDWTQLEDGFYYHNGAVEPDDYTEVLIENASVAETANAPEGYSLSIEIISQAIQADGEDADGKTPVELAWGVEAAKAVGAIQ